MNDYEKLKAFLVSVVDRDYGGCFYGIKEMNLQQLKDLRELVKMVIIDRLCTENPKVYEKIFTEGD